MYTLRNVTVLIMAVLILTSFVPSALAEGEPKLDLNKASVEELVQLNGIGQVYAERIVEYREVNGSFKQVEDVMKINGIGEKTFDSIKGSIVVKSPSS